MTYRHETRPATKPTAETVRRHLTGRMTDRARDRGTEESATEQLARILEGGMRAQPRNFVYTADDESRVVPGMTPGAFTNGPLHVGMSVGELVDSEGRLYSVPRGMLAGERMTFEAAGITNSRTCQFGAILMPTPMNVRALGVAGALEEIPSEFVTVRPAAFARPPMVGDDFEVPDSPFPVSIAKVDREGFPQYAYRFGVSRGTMRQRGVKQLAGEIVATLALGFGRAVDAELLGAITAAAPEPFTLSAAAAAGVRFEELRALVGTDGAGASAIDGHLFAAGIPAELTGDVPQTIVAAFSRFAVATYEEIEVLVQRTERTGNLTVTCWLSLQALMPDGGSHGRSPDPQPPRDGERRPGAGGACAVLPAADRGPSKRRAAVRRGGLHRRRQRRLPGEPRLRRGDGRRRADQRRRHVPLRRGGGCREAAGTRLPRPGSSPAPARRAARAGAGRQAEPWPSSRAPAELGVGLVREAGVSDAKMKLTVLADRGLEEALRAEQARLRDKLGLDTSLSAVAAMAMRNGLKAPLAEAER